MFLMGHHDAAFIRSADRLLFNVLWSAWILAGTLLEERDLSREFGAEYGSYAKNVPMLIPFLKRKR